MAMSVDCLVAERRRRNLGGWLITEETLETWWGVFRLSVLTDDHRIDEGHDRFPGLE